MKECPSDPSWLISEHGFNKKRTEILGSKLLIGNGYLGYRGTLEEYSKDQLVACTLSGVYDRHQGAWREPVNAPNGLAIQLFSGNRLLSPLLQAPRKHTQTLNIRHGLHRRETLFSLPKGGQVQVTSERFASMANPHLLGLKYSFQATKKTTLRLQCGVDSDVWDVNGPHFKTLKSGNKDGLLWVEAKTNEGKTVAIAESSLGLPGKARIIKKPKSILREWVISIEAGVTYSVTKFASIFTSQDTPSPLQAALSSCRAAQSLGYTHALAESQQQWERLWTESDVTIEGDPAGQEALRFSIYHLLSIATSHTDRASIPARGLSGQVYKGAIFWDTEMFMLPFFLYTQPQLARNLVQYRFHTLDGARKKARALGYRGAFYAWESQESGEEACTLFNITDILTGRPLRTYFADKQIHISADVAYGIWQYYALTGDESLLLDGGAEVILECARFFYSYAYFKADKGRYEMLDVTGPDEYHERVHNNAFSSAMARKTVGIALEAISILKKSHPKEFARLIWKIGFEDDLKHLAEFHQKLYVPQPDSKTGVIEQFDGYHKLEKISLPDLKKRMLNPKEYWGGGQGLATTTQIIKQADVLTLLNVLGSDYSPEIKKANWEFYEPNTEHGSSLSPCIYALVAAAIGKTEWAYRYFLKTATVDLTGDSKQYVGSLYIGGTHPAANGGAWMAAVLGFGGLSASGQVLNLNPALPKLWKSLSFRVAFRSQHLSVTISGKTLTVVADASNTQACPLRIQKKALICGPGTVVRATLSRNQIT